MAVIWQTWSKGLPEQAAADGRPVLLVLVADWSLACDEQLEQLLCEHEVATLIDEVCVPVRVDVAAEPELAERLGQGSWPSLALLDEAGDAVWSAVAPLPAELALAIGASAQMLRGEPSAASELSRAADTNTEKAPIAHISGRIDASIPPAIERLLLSDFDSLHGGFGTGQKFPHPETLDYAILALAEERDPRLLEIVEKTLSSMAASGLRDPISGAFFRYSEERDWSRPHTEVTLATNAGLSRNYLEAGQLLGRADFLELGEATLDMLIADLLDEEVGLFVDALPADPGYYALGEAERRTHPGPQPQQRFLAETNARAVSALLKAGAVLGRADLSTRGAAVAEQLLLRLWRPGKGMLQLDDGSEGRHKGRLRDHAETARAVLHVLQYTGDRRFVEPLFDLVELIASQHVLPSGELGDNDLPLTAIPSQAAILDGAVACEVLLRTALALGRDDLHQLAVTSLRVHADDFRRYGYAMSAFGRSVDLVLHPPLHVLVVGPDSDDGSRALLGAASALYLPSRVVQSLDPELDHEHLQRLGLPWADEPAAYIITRAWSSGPFTTTQALSAGLVSADALRRSR
jgi:uncharacterized protein YyaL (SSP411 family)